MAKRPAKTDRERCVCNRCGAIVLAGEDCESCRRFFKAEQQRRYTQDEPDPWQENAIRAMEDNGGG